MLSRSTVSRSFATAAEVKMQEEKQKPSEKDLARLADAMVLSVLSDYV